MFVWARIPGVAIDALLPNAIASKVIFVPGKAFFADNADPASLRLSFAAPNVDEIREGVARLQHATHATRTTRKASAASVSA